MHYPLGLLNVLVLVHSSLVTKLICLMSRLDLIKSAHFIHDKNTLQNKKKIGNLYYLFMQDEEGCCN